MSQDRLDASLDIDRRSTLEIVRIIQQQDALVAQAVAAEAERIAHAVDEIANRMAHGGRMFYVGAGTSGRIAMLDAAELPPTFGIDPSLVRVLMAGGERAYFAAAEGAEDDEEAAIAAVEKEVIADDAVVGIAASGTTPYTVAAIRKANMIGALTVGITSQPGSPLAQDADIAIVPKTGPEVIMGSSRMKSGTAQKMVLNTISTAVMMRLGYYNAVQATSRRFVDPAEWDYWIAGKPAARNLPGAFGDVTIRKGQVRDGGSFPRRTCRYASWNSVFREHAYQERRWRDFRKA